VTKTFVVVTRLVLIVAVVLAAMTSVFSVLAGVSAEAPKCAGRAWVEGYRNGIWEFLGLPLSSAVLVILVGTVALGRSERIRSFLRVYDLPVLEFASMQVSFGESAIYSALLMALAMLGIMTGASAIRYNAIVNYCLAATAFN